MSALSLDKRPITACAVAIRIHAGLSHAFNEKHVPVEVAATVIMSYLNGTIDKDTESDFMLQVTHDYACMCAYWNDAQKDDLHTAVGKALYDFYKERNHVSA